MADWTTSWTTGCAINMITNNIIPMDTYLNMTNIERSDDLIEYHPLKPFLPEGCKVLFLGSFPPQRKRWCIDFFYPNFINDHWRIEGIIFYGDKNHFVNTKENKFNLQQIISFARTKGLGFYDTATSVKRLKDNASDKFLEVVEPTDISKLLNEVPSCKIVVTTGEKATDTICKQMGIKDMPKVGTVKCFTLGERLVYLYRLPSSSRAYPLSLDKKAEEYRKMFEFAGIL